MKRLMPALWFGAVAMFVALAAANLYMGDLNQDEGWYLYAGRMVAEGAVPYRDFAFTQGPVMAYTYALANPLVGLWGVAGGRLFTVLLSALAAGLTACLAARLVARPARPTAALIAFLFIAGNVYQSYFCTVVKTYALSSLLLIAGFLALSFGAARRRGPLVAGAVLLVLAAGTRASAVMALPAAFLGLLLDRERRAAFDWLWFGVAAALAGCALFLPFLLRAPDGFIFGVIQYHAARSGGGGFKTLVYKLGFLSRVTQAYYLALAALVVVLLARHLRATTAGAPAADAEGGARPAFLTALWITVVAVTLVHTMAPFPYDDYQATIYPLFAALVAASLVRLAAQPGQLPWIAVTVFALSVGSAFSSPMNQSLFVQGRDRIWWRMKDQPPIRRLHAAAAQVRALAGRPDDELLTQDTYLAVEAHLRVPRGLELGPFSYYPNFSRARAERLRVVNREMLRDMLRAAAAPVAAFSGYGLAIRAPEIEELSRGEQDELSALVRQRYTDVADIANFGQGYTTLHILARQPTAPVVP